jgi:hypothetical protein
MRPAMPSHKSYRGIALGFYNVEKPDLGIDWSLCLQLLFPK